jgi:hypothetical protein
MLSIKKSRPLLRQSVWVSHLRLRQLRLAEEMAPPVTAMAAAVTALPVTEGAALTVTRRFTVITVLTVAAAPTVTRRSVVTVAAAPMDPPAMGVMATVAPIMKVMVTPRTVAPTTEVTGVDIRSATHQLWLDASRDRKQPNTRIPNTNENERAR